MQADPKRQTRKRLATRQRISDVATRLFIQHGFDHVTIDQIANAADVSRMTVFNHFARKEDLFFDLDDQVRADVHQAIQHRPTGTSPIEALRLFAHQAIAERRPYVRFDAPNADRFLAAIRASEPLKARARAIRDEAVDTLAKAFAQATKRRTPTASTHLAASLLVATWSVAFTQAHEVFHQTQSCTKANKAFLKLIDQGSRGIVSALDDAPPKRT